MSRQGNLIVISGPSGSGKSTLCRRLLQSDSGVGLAVSHTTRPRREGEVHGQDYSFLSVQEFEKGIQNGDYLEFADVHGNYYGTPHSEVQRLTRKGVDVILEIDVQGGLQVRRQLEKTILIFVAPPTFEELKVRLTGRGTDAKEVIEKRISNALNELKQMGLYDYLLINDELVEARRRLESILETERMRISSLNLAAVSSIMRIPLK